MSQEILAVKLSELDERIGKMHSRIHLNEFAGHGQLKCEMEALRKECAQTEKKLGEELRFSKTETTSILSEAYNEAERIIEKAKEKMEVQPSGYIRGESDLEEKILLAEYMLDFAMLAADHALLVSLEAIDAQKEQSRKNERSLS